MTTEIREDVSFRADHESAISPDQRDEIIGAMHLMFMEHSITAQPIEISALLGLLVQAELSAEEEDEAKVRMDILQARFRQVAGRGLPHDLALNNIYHSLRQQFEDKLIFHERVN